MTSVRLVWELNKIVFLEWQLLIRLRDLVLKRNQARKGTELGWFRSEIVGITSRNYLESMTKQSLR